VNKYLHTVASVGFLFTFFQRKVVEKIRTNSFRKLIVYEIVWENAVKTGRPQMTM